MKETREREKKTVTQWFYISYEMYLKYYLENIHRIDQEKIENDFLFIYFGIFVKIVVTYKNCVFY